jgi:hypothetical protein
MMLRITPVWRRMQPNRSHAAAGSLSRLARRMALLALLTACGSKQPVDLGALPPAPIPTYGLGDSYQFNDGSGDAVISVGGDVIRWQAKNGTYVTARDVLLPRLAWDTGGETGERRFAVGPLQLFPLEAGKGVRFHAARIVRHIGGDQPATVEEDWRCGVAGTASVATQAGDFQTWRIDCAMRETPAVTGNGEVQRSFYYAPDIGFYVRTEERIGDGPPHVADLLSYTTSDPILSATALRQRSMELQRALEALPSGSQTTWSDATTGADGKVSLLDTRLSDRYGWCRDFAERIRWSGRSYSLHGIGCRNPEKVWEIVMLAPGSAGRE